LTRSSSRLWRLRKRHQYIDAELFSGEDDRSAEIQFLINGELSYRRAWATREEALAEAAAKRTELEREGWAEHW
jgi:hypothetical protein